MTRQNNDRNNKLNKDKQFVDAIQADLTASVENINAGDLSAITQLRNTALSGKDNKRSGWVYVSAGAFATLFFAMIVFSFIQMSPDLQNQQHTSPEDLLVDSSILEFDNEATLPVVESFVVYGVLDVDPDVSEQIEFYEWLDTYESSGQGQG